MKTNAPNSRKMLRSLRLAWFGCVSTVLAASSAVHAQSAPADTDGVSGRIEKLEQQLADQARQIKMLQEGLVPKNEPPPISDADDAVSYTHLTLPTIYSV